MIYYGINDIYRKKIYKNNKRQILNYLNSLNQFTRDRSLHIIINDGYQILSKRANKTDDKTSKKLFSILKTSDFSHIKSVLEDNYRLFQILYVHAKGFWELPIIDRCILINETLDSTELCKLKELDPFYIVDVCVYSLQKDIDSLNYYHKDYSNRFQITDISDFYTLVINILSKLKKENSQLYFSNLLEIMKGFYINHKFLEDIDESLVSFSKEYCNMLEKYDLELVEKELFNSFEHFSDIICQYFVYKTDLENSKEIKQFIGENISPEMIKKLKIIP